MRETFFVSGASGVDLIGVSGPPDIDDVRR